MEAETRRTDGALAGAVGALVALGLSELLAGIIRPVPSLITAVGTAVIDFAPPAVKDWAIATLGIADKPALIAGIVVVSTLFGAGLGAAATRARWIAAAGFLGFATLGALAAARDPRADDLASALVAAVTALSGSAAVILLLRRAGSTAPVESGPDPNRRAFLRGAGTFALLAGIAALGGRYLMDRMKVATSRAEVVLPSAAAPLPLPPGGAELGVDGLSPVVTPNAEFYRIDTALAVPRVELESWRLTITGRIDRPVELTYQDLLAMPMVERYVTLSCVSNEVGGDLVGNAKWLGVPLRDLLDRAGVQAAATQIVGRSVDDFTAGFPTEAAFDGREALVAVGMNGEPLPIEHGFPARLVVAGLYGYVSATKWLAEIELTTWGGFDAYWVPRGWAKEAPIKTQSRIDVPRPNAELAAGVRRIAGVAWAPNRGIRKVEVQVDEGGWQEAALSEPLGDDAWRQWNVDWDPQPGAHTLRVRATDGRGETQVEARSSARPDGATGHHTISVTVA